MPATEASRPPGRPTLATAGAALAALVVLQGAQQAVGVFSPRPLIQVALIAAVASAALLAERLRATESALRDPLAVTSMLGCVAALAAAGAISLTSGFSRPAPASVGAQVDDVRASLIKEGFKVRYERLRLHQGPRSHLFVLTARGHSQRPVSDEIRLYEVSEGKLRLAAGFRPTVTSEDPPDQAFSAAFRMVAVRDVDGDGQKEIFGSYDTNQAGLEFQRVPVVISRKAAEGRYEVTPLLSVRSLGRAASSGLPEYGFGSRDGRPAPSIWVGDLALDPGRVFLRNHVVLATSVVLVEGDPHSLSLIVEPARADGGRATGIPRPVRFWDLDTDGGVPRVRPLCLQTGAPEGPTGEHVVRVPARALETPAFLGAPLAEAMRAASIGLGELIEGACLDATA